MKLKSLLIALLLLASFYIVKSDYVPLAPDFMSLSHPEAESTTNPVNISVYIVYGSPLTYCTINITGPAGYGYQVQNMSGVKNDVMAWFWYNTTYPIVGDYSFYIWAKTLSGNVNQTGIHSFFIYSADLIVDDNAAPSWYDATHVHTIQEAINNATAGNGIYVLNGAYSGFIVNKTVNITAQSKSAIATGTITIQNPSEINNFAVNGYINMVSTAATVSNCNITGGINLSTSNGTISDNNIKDGGGVKMVTSKGTVTGNTITNCSIGINIDAASTGSIIYANNFLSNTLQARDYAAVGQNLWDNSKWGNYWGNYTDVDLNHDYIWDHPFVVTDGNKDNYPLVNLWAGLPDPAVVYVDDDYTPSTPYWGYDHFSSLYNGLQALWHGAGDTGYHTLYLYAGTYARVIPFFNPHNPNGWKLSIIGEDKDTTIVDSAGAGPGIWLDDVYPGTISNITFCNGTGDDFAGLYLERNEGIDPNNVTIQDCIFDNVHNGVVFTDATPGYDYCKIKNCLFKNLIPSVFLMVPRGYAVQLMGDHNSIENCTSLNQGGAFALVVGAYNTIIYNYIDMMHNTWENSVSIQMAGCHDNLITKNEFWGNESKAVNVTFQGIYLDSSNYHNRIFNNNFLNNMTVVDNNGGGALYWNYFYGQNETGVWVGNYWEDYLLKYPYALPLGYYWNQPYYIFDSVPYNEFDNYPMINPFILFPRPWDIIIDRVIDILDVSSFVSHYGQRGVPDWIRDDIDDDGKVSYLDASILCIHYGETY